MTDTPNPGALAGSLSPREHTDDNEATAFDSAAFDSGDFESAVEAALGQLEALPDLPVTDHVHALEGVQQRLSELLRNVDDA